MPVSREKKSCGCCSLIFTLGVSAVLLWLWLENSKPKCFIQALYLSSLNTTSNLTRTNPTLNLTLRLINPNQLKGLKYGPLNVTVYDLQNKSNVIGNILMPGFYQGYRKKASKLGLCAANTTVALRAVSGNGTAVFRVHLVTAVKFKTWFWYGERHRISVGANVVVNASGVKLNREGIRLRRRKSMAPKMGSYCVVLGALVNLLVFTLLDFW